MKKWSGLLFGCSVVLLAAACTKTNNNSPYPQISITTFIPDSVKAGSDKDTVKLFYKFTDGDGDLGVSETPTNNSLIVLKDSRNTDSLLYYMPSIDPSYIDPAKGMEGNSVVFIYASLLTLRPDSAHAAGDTLTFSMYVLDNAGNKSNTVTTPQLLLRP
jgi:hypothetical protein